MTVFSHTVGSWSIACRCCSNYIFIFDFTPGFNKYGKDNCTTKWESFTFCDLARLYYGICYLQNVHITPIKITLFTLYDSSLLWMYVLYRFIRATSTVVQMWQARGPIIRGLFLSTRYTTPLVDYARLKVKILLNTGIKSGSVITMHHSIFNICRHDDRWTKKTTQTVFTDILHVYFWVCRLAPLLIFGLTYIPPGQLKLSL